MNAETPVGKVVLGFLAGAIAVPLAHQVMVLILYALGYVANAPYSLRANPWGVPAILNLMFWGGVWGIVFALVVGWFKPGWATWLKGIVFGLGIHVILGNWLVVALIRGQALFAGLAPQRMLIGALIGTAFGIGVAYIHAALASRLAR